MINTPSNPTDAANKIVWRLGEINANPDLANNQEILSLGYCLADLRNHLKEPEVITKIREAISYLEQFAQDVYDKWNIEKERFISALRKTLESCFTESTESEESV